MIREKKTNKLGAVSCFSPIRLLTVIFAVSTATGLTSPLASTVATVGLSDFQDTDLFVASTGVTVAIRVAEHTNSHSRVFAAPI